ncbi:iron uptake transporter permease EfeU [Pseudoxanthobacter sp.]|uniref:iron uptake transporter permease EfeU n=1 Tax=Pseudoxanthobacter sp. TaxID=1925742 RepID=UPI002FE27634
MLAPFLIMLREGVEAALIVGIIAGYLKQIGRSDLMPAVWLGILTAIALALFAGAGLQLVSAEFPQKEQELFEAVVGLIAVGVLTWMVFWMRRAARSIRGELHAGVDRALQGSTFALIAMVFLAVAREGLESVFFLLAIFQQSDSALAPLGALLGVIAAVAVGYGIYAGGVRLDLRRFFRWTGVFILFVAAGLLANAVRAFHEAGVWNGLQATAFDISAVLPADGPAGALLSGMFGYRDAPAIGEVIAYVVFLAVALVLFLAPPASAAPRRAAGHKV